MQSKIEQVKAKVAQCIAKAEATYKITMPKVQLRFDLTGRSAGQAGHQWSYTAGATNFYLRFNTTHMQLGGQTWEHLINDTVPHEVAHTVCQAFPKLGRAHDTGWKSVCRALGGNGRRCYTPEDAPEAVAKQRPFTYTSTSGHSVSVSPIIHSKIQTRGAAYRYRGMGTVNKSCAYTSTALHHVTKKAAPVAPTAPVVTTPTVLATAQGSNADRLRAYLAHAKRNVGSEAAEKTVLWAMATLGMKAALARTYVKNNWNKV